MIKGFGGIWWILAKISWVSDKPMMGQTQCLGRHFAPWPFHFLAFEMLKSITCADWTSPAVLDLGTSSHLANGRPLDALARLLRVSGHESFLPTNQMRLAVVLSGWSGWTNRGIFGYLSDSQVGLVMDSTSNSTIPSVELRNRWRNWYRSVPQLTRKPWDPRKTMRKTLRCSLLNQFCMFCQYHESGSIGLLVSN